MFLAVILQTKEENEGCIIVIIFSTAGWAGSSEFVTAAKGKGPSQMVFKPFINARNTSLGTFPDQ